jgi:hypothetical protein
VNGRAMSMESIVSYASRILKENLAGFIRLKDSFLDFVFYLVSCFLLFVKYVIEVLTIVIVFSLNFFEQFREIRREHLFEKGRYADKKNGQKKNQVFWKQLEREWGNFFSRINIFNVFNYAFRPELLPYLPVDYLESMLEKNDRIFIPNIAFYNQLKLIGNFQESQARFHVLIDFRKKEDLQAWLRCLDFLCRKKKISPENIRMEIVPSSKHEKDPQLKKNLEALLDFQALPFFLATDSDFFSNFIQFFHPLRFPEKIPGFVKILLKENFSFSKSSRKAQREFLGNHLLIFQGEQYLEAAEFLAFFKKLDFPEKESELFNALNCRKELKHHELIQKEDCFSLRNQLASLLLHKEKISAENRETFFRKCLGRLENEKNLPLKSLAGILKKMTFLSLDTRLEVLGKKSLEGILRLAFLSSIPFALNEEQKGKIINVLLSSDEDPELIKSILIWTKGSPDLDWAKYILPFLDSRDVVLRELALESLDSMKHLQSQNEAWHSWVREMTS